MRGRGHGCPASNQDDLAMRDLDRHGWRLVRKDPMAGHDHRANCRGSQLRPGWGGKSHGEKDWSDCRNSIGCNALQTPFQGQVLMLLPVALVVIDSQIIAMRFGWVPILGWLVTMRGLRRQGKIAMETEVAPLHAEELRTRQRQNGKGEESALGERYHTREKVGGTGGPFNEILAFGEVNHLNPPGPPAKGQDRRPTRRSAGRFRRGERHGRAASQPGRGYQGSIRNRPDCTTKSRRSH